MGKQRQKRSETKILKLIVVQGDDYLRDYLIVTLFFFCKLIFFFSVIFVLHGSIWTLNVLWVLLCSPLFKLFICNTHFTPL